MTFLKKVRSEQIEELNIRNLVMPNSRYNYISNTNANKRWHKICEELGIDYKGMHAFRHTFATRYLEATGNKDIKGLSVHLGHKDVLTTMNTYQSVLKEQKKATVLAVDKFI